MSLRQVMKPHMKNKVVSKTKAGLKLIGEPEEVSALVVFAGVDCRDIAIS